MIDRTEARWWTCLRGTRWSLLDAENAHADDAAQSITDRGGIVRPATDGEVAAWAELTALTAELRRATSEGARLDLLAVDTLAAEQGSLL